MCVFAAFQTFAECFLSAKIPKWDPICGKHSLQCGYKSGRIKLIAKQGRLHGYISRVRVGMSVENKLSVTDRPTDQLTDRPTDGQSGL